MDPKEVEQKKEEYSKVRTWSIEVGKRCNMHATHVVALRPPPLLQHRRCLGSGLTI